MNGPPSVLKPLARGLSRMLATDTGARAAIQAQLAVARGIVVAQELGVSQERAPEERAAAGPTLRVGIWAAHDGDEGREWRRVAVEQDWFRFADVARIGPKRGRRVLLFGESAARGYFYDPEHNVAGALERALQTSIADGVEVVDLARTGITLDQMLDLVRASRALEPDAVVFFAGNNWRPFATIEEVKLGDFLRLARALRGGIHRARGLLEGQLEGDVTRFMRAVLELRRDVPVLVVIPEFNLLDWRSDAGRPAPWLLDGRNEPWMDARARAEAALAAGDSEEAARAATRMLELDEGVSAAAPSLLARAELMRGGAARARRFLEMAKDAEMWDPRTPSPRCYGVTQRSLREQAAASGVPMVDLPKLFFEHLEGALPDRRLFHDYCHMTATGIALAVRAVAEQVLPLLGAAVRREALSAVDLMPTPRVQAAASLAVAVHCANWAQPSEIVHHHCAEALSTYPEVAESMEVVMDLHVRRAPKILCTGFSQLSKAETRIGARCLTEMPRSRRTFGAELPTMLSRSLEGSRPGTVERLERLRIEEHAVDRGPLDLLNGYSTASFVEEDFGWMGTCAFYKAYEPRSRFFLVCRSPARAVVLDVALRVQSLAAPTPVAVFVNGTRIASVPCARTWSRARVSAPAAALRAGVNRIELAWPRAVLSERGALDRLADTLQAGGIPDIYPIFGEVHRLNASVAAE